MAHRRGVTARESLARVLPATGPCQKLGDASAPETPTDAGVLSVVLVDTSKGTICFGPFDSASHAALYWHDITSGLELTNEYATRVCELVSPGLDVASASASGTTPGDDRVRGWVVRLPPADPDADDDTPRVIGLFDDQPSARDWRPDSSSSDAPASISILPVYQP